MFFYSLIERAFNRWLDKLAFKLQCEHDLKRLSCWKQ